MKWIIVAILVTIIPYTWITLAFRKPNPAHEPYQDNKDRAQVLRLLDHGFARIDLAVDRLIDPPVPPAESAHAEAIEGGLPPLLSDLLIDKPPVPTDFPFVAAPVSTLSGAPYTLFAACTQPDLDEHVSKSQLYQRNQELVIIIGYQQNPEGLQSRRREVTTRITIPPNTLEPGEYRATLIGARESRRWTFEVY
ncbi:MAG: hypothetical protein SynsKO_37290 [Synoicihabitans sp.]